MIKTKVIFKCLALKINDSFLEIFCLISTSKDLKRRFFKFNFSKSINQNKVSMFINKFSFKIKSMIKKDIQVNLEDQKLVNWGL